jgi:hypothetical protein
MFNKYFPEPSSINVCESLPQPWIQDCFDRVGLEGSDPEDVFAEEEKVLKMD